MNTVDRQYEDLLADVLKNGVEKKDRTGVGTLSVFGRQLRYDLNNGFPRITTKFVPMKSVKAELLWQIEGSTSEPRLKELGANWWEPWADRDGELGPVYGKQMRMVAYTNAVKPWLFDASPLRAVPLSGVLYRGKDVNIRSVYGVGYYGDADFKDPDYNWLVGIWRQMIRRCYDPTCKTYEHYGAKGVHVAESWHSFANFQRDVKEIPNWVMKKEYPRDFSLDKDVLHASNRYGPDTCMWASHDVQYANRGNSNPVLAVSPDGEEIMRPSIGSVEREAPHNTVLRYNQVDQLAYVIASLKHAPDSRRHVISLWSPAAIPFQALPPCHGVVIQFYVEGGKLSCSMYQRSADLFLGLPTNIASYSLLTHMVAQQTGYDVGEFIWTGGDCHIYKNHVVAVREQLGRNPYPFPELSLKKAPSIFEYEMSDIYASAGYKHHPAIKAPVAV